MPFEIIRNDITKVKADAIVNTANPRPVIGEGTDSAVYMAAGRNELLAERRRIGDIAPGSAAATPAFALDAEYIIHTVGPVWTDGSSGEEETLRSCYRESLALAAELSCESIAFPLIATGVYGFPKDLAIRTATSEIYDFLMKNDMLVYLVVFDRSAYELSGKLFSDVKAYIDENYASEKRSAEFAFDDGLYASNMIAVRRNRRREYDAFAARHKERADTAGGSGQTPSVEGSGQLEDYLKSAGKSFREYLMELIIARGMSNPDVYHGANLTKQHFSKILSGKDYRPSKNTVCALALSLRLDPMTADKLLESAGFALSKSSRFDLCIEYFLRNGMYNVIDNNIILYENGLELLGRQN